MRYMKLIIPEGSVIRYTWRERLPGGEEAVNTVRQVLDEEYLETYAIRADMLYQCEIIHVEDDRGNVLYRLKG